MDNLHVMITPKEMSLVRRIAAEIYRDYCPAGEAGQITREDLCHHGVIGLMESKQTYDKSRGVPWLHFAAFRVRGAMMDQLRTQPMIRLPQARQQKVKQLREARAQLAREGLDARPESLARRLAWSVDEIHHVSRLSPSLIQAEEERTDRDPEGGRNGEVLRDEGNDPESLTLKKEIAELVRKCLESLPSPQDRLVIVSRVVDGLKLKDLATTFGCSIENIRQWQKRVEKLMRLCLERNGWSMEG
jgi:RNA polymerase sigma factor FliA